MNHVRARARDVRGSAGRCPWQALSATLALLVSGFTLACGSGSAGAYDSAYRLGEQTSASAVEANEAERAVHERLTFEPLAFQQTTSLDTLPKVAKACAVKYVVSAEQWGVVPDLTYPCDDPQARQKALADARDRVRSASGEYEARLATLRGPVEIMKEDGPALVLARALDVGFDLGACVTSVSQRIEDSAAEVSTLQCETFLKPGTAPADLRRRLDQAAERALGTVEVSAAQPALAIASTVAAACRADPGEGSLTVPGSVAGVLTSGRDKAYAIRVDAGQGLTIGLSSTAFDSMLRLYDASCTRVLASDDDSGSGNNAQLSWRSPAAGVYVVVVSSYQRAGRGPYELRISTPTRARALSDEEREAVRAFADWVKRASEDELLSTWRATGPVSLQLGCLNQARYQSRAVRRAAAVSEALAVCKAGLKQATDARRELIAAAGK